jgi:outer membrane protein assembly factor BamB
MWRSELKSGDFVNVVVNDGDLYATTKGEVFCLDPGTVQIRWRNELKGLGLGLVTVASGGLGIAAMSEKRRRDQASAAE